MEFIFGMLSDLRAVSAIIKRLSFWSESKGLKMKTYTFSWRAYKWRKENALCRFFLRFETSITAVEFFCYELSHFDYEHRPYSRPHSLRLTCCGRLIARQATYQGV